MDFYNASNTVYWGSLCLIFFGVIFVVFIFFYIRSIIKRGFDRSNLMEYELTDKNHGGKYRG